MAAAPTCRVRLATSDFASASRSFKGNMSASFKISATSRFTAKLYALRNDQAFTIRLS